MSIEKIDRLQQEQPQEIPDDPLPSQSTLRCDHCSLSVRSTYHEVGGQILCSPCKWEMEKTHRDGLNSRRMVFATSLGTLAAIVGAGIFFTILMFFKFNFAAIPLIIGLLVGIAVRIGSRRRGGPVYQALAMILTYIAVAATQLPAVHDTGGGPDQAGNTVNNSAYTQDISPSADTASAQSKGISDTKQLAFAFISPIASMLENVIGFIFLCAGMLAAWKLNQRARMTVSCKKVHKVLGLESDLVISERCRES